MNQESAEEKRREIGEKIAGQKKQLKILLGQRIKDLAFGKEQEELVGESYHALQEEILANIHFLELELQKCSENDREQKSMDIELDHSHLTALEIMDGILKDGRLDRKDMEILIERIEVDENGLPEITLKYALR